MITFSSFFQSHLIDNLTEQWGFCFGSLQYRYFSVGAEDGGTTAHNYIIAMTLVRVTGAFFKGHSFVSRILESDLVFARTFLVGVYLCKGACAR